MSTRRERIEIEIDADGRDAAKELDKTGKKFDSFKSGVDKAAKGAAVAGAGIGAIGVAAFGAARDAERATTTIERVFGDAAGTLKGFSEDAAENVGVSTAAYEGMAAKIGESLKGMGLDTETAATKTNELLTVAGDMALALGTDVPAATDALGAALRGEFDALSEFGVKVDDTTIKAGLAAQGINGPDGMTQAAYDAAYQQELLNQVLGTAGQVYGGYRAETDTTAERQDVLTAKWDDALAKLGTELTPAIEWAAEKLEELVDWIDNNSDAIDEWLPWIFGAIGAVWLLNWALAANPIVLITILVLGLAAALFVFRERILGWVIPALDTLWSNLSSGDFWGDQFGDMLDILGISADDFATTIDNISGALNNLWDWFSRNWSFSLPSVPLAPAGLSAPAGFAAFDTVPATGRAMLAADTAAAGPTSASSLSSLSGLGSAGGPGVTVINVTGALDPDAVARQVESLLRRRARRTGPVITL